MMKCLLYWKPRTTPPARPEEQTRGQVKYLNSRGLKRKGREPAMSIECPLSVTAYGRNFYLYGR